MQDYGDARELAEQFHDISHRLLDRMHARQFHWSGNTDVRAKQMIGAERAETNAWADLITADRERVRRECADRTIALIKTFDPESRPGWGDYEYCRIESAIMGTEKE